MADETDKPALDPQPRRRVPPPTIDLEATDVSPAAETASGSTSESKSEPPPSDSAAAESTGAGSESAAPEGTANPGAAEPTRAARAERRSGAGVAAIAAAATGAALALIAAGAAWMVFGPDRNQGRDVDARLSGIEAQLAALPKAAPPSVDPQALDAVNRRLGEIEAALARPSPPAAPANEQAVADLGRRLDEAAAAARDARSRADAAKAAADAAAKAAAEAASAPASAPAPAPPEGASAAPAADRTDLDALAGRIGRLDSDQKALADRIARLDGDQKALADRIAGAESKSESAVQADSATARAAAGATASAGDARAGVAALALALAVERGGPYARELAAIDQKRADKGALDALAPFAASGVPSAAALARELERLVPTARAAAAPPAPQGGLIDRLKADAARLVRVRPIGEPTGDDPSAVLARLETAAARADLAAARTDAAKLPGPARAPLEPWLKRVAEREAALAAASSLVAHALDALRTSSVGGAPAR